ncbi:MAG: hypothetical protein ACI4HQ_03140 [Acetatifactor sp.]
MNFAFLASFIALILVISIAIRKQAKQTKQNDAEFWSREQRANAVRRKSLDNLNYIQIPLEKFPTNLMQEDLRILECIDIMESLTSRKIVNFTGYSNTDLKLEYGTGNLEALTEYDQNYTVLVRTLQKWADLLLEGGYEKEASVLMEYAVSIDTDVSRTYYLLANYYVSCGKMVQIDYLKKKAETLRSANKEVILRNLREKYPDVF